MMIDPRPSVEELRERYIALGLISHNGGKKRNYPTHKTALTAAEKAAIDRLRPTHTLAELGEMFHRHPATIREACKVKVDLRGKRH